MGLFMDDCGRLTAVKVNEVLKRTQGDALADYLGNEENQQTLLRVYQNSCKLSPNEAESVLRNLLEEIQEEYWEHSGHTFSRSRTGGKHALPWKVR